MSEYTPTTEEASALIKVGDNIFTLDPKFDRWLAEHDREKQAQAWEEGYLASRRNRQAHEWLSASNPYRQGKNNE